MPRTLPTPRSREAGFSLIELAIGLVIVATLLAALLVPLGTQVEQRRAAETVRRMDAARDALLGFAVSNGRLPCPASDASNGREVLTPPAADGVCTQMNGWLPGVTLGLTNLDDNGYYRDGYELGNVSRIRYAVVQPDGTTPAGVPANAFTKVDGIKGVNAEATRANMRAIANTNGLFTICNKASTESTSCAVESPPPPAPPTPDPIIIADGNAIAVLTSQGPKATTRAASADEIENNELGNDRVFVSRVHSEATGNEFDDHVLWISPSVLFYRMTSVGALP
jgi:prepilin-type N-terminal cleavage/methylation domain-containing protein